MSKTLIFRILLILGSFFIGFSLGLTVYTVSSMDIIGGAGWPTFSFVFFQENGGLFALLFALGLCAILGAYLVKNRQP